MTKTRHTRRSRRLRRLPPLARRFLRTYRSERKERAFWRFHRWLEALKLDLSHLTPAAIEQFRAHCAAPAAQLQTQRRNQRDLLAYLHWLHQHGVLSLPTDSQAQARRSPVPLPALVQQFIDTLTPTLRPSTCAQYATVLRTFYRWFTPQKMDLSDVERHHLEAYFLHLTNCGLHPATRAGILMITRRYFRWLFEREQLAAYPDDLIRGCDFPKLPQYLPRPLTPEIDRIVQTRLADAGHPLATGLLLMRHTGLRIGELRNLAYDCVRHDTHNNPFLKVPLGKLNNERLVPLSEDAARLIETLQANRPKTCTHLLEQSSGRPACYKQLRRIFVEATRCISTPEPITSHRMRHTYATSLLNGGMSLVGVMKLLGHRSITMTLRYTAIAQQTVTTEYEDALKRLQETYACLATPKDADTFCPHKSLADLIAWLRNHLPTSHHHRNTARALIRRLQSIQAHLDHFPS